MPLPLLGIPKEVRDRVNQSKNLVRIEKMKRRMQAETPKLANGLPTEEEIQEGSPQLRFIESRGLYLFAKYNSVIYHTLLTEGLPEQTP